MSGRGIRPQISITKDQALFLLVDDSFIPSTSSMMLQIYQDYCHADGYLYITLVSGPNIYTKNNPITKLHKNAGIQIYLLIIITDYL